ncbi:MAG: DNA repair protein RadC [candidate division FCPU426 bacterium]
MDRLVPLSQWPEMDKPRERLARLGPASLSDAELIAILLGQGTRGVTAVDLGRRLLQRSEGLERLGRLAVSDLAALSGIGIAKASRLVAACELGRRRERPAVAARPPVRSSQEAAKLISARLRDLEQEAFCLLLLDSRHRLLAEPVISLGGLDQAPVHPREVFRAALSHPTAAVIVAHNHPSGDPAPSESDVALTQRLAAGAELLGLRLLDHIIIGKGVFISLAEKGHLQTSSQSLRSTQSPAPGLRRGQ